MYTAGGNNVRICMYTLYCYYEYVHRHVMQYYGGMHSSHEVLLQQTLSNVTIITVMIMTIRTCERAICCGEASPTDSIFNKVRNI